MTRFLVALALLAGLSLGLAEPGASNPLTKAGIGAYGVSNIPLVQDDAGKGALFGIRGRFGLPVITFEPSINFIKNGDGEADVDGTTIALDPPKLTSYALNVLLKGGFMYTTAGIGVTSVEIKGGVGKSKEPTYNFGGGLEIGVGVLSIDVSPRLFIINTADKASRKNLLIMAGATYYFF